jgi:uncharacterized protein
MYFRRNIDTELLNWKNTSDRRPLLLRGARQVGKSSSVREFAKHFETFIEVNFESHKEVHSFFDGNIIPKEICESLEIFYKTSITEGSTLIFFDEIQSCKNAINSLRFFYEQFPDLHIIAAGSLLEFTFAELPSFGVGRIRSMYLYPFSFDEFLNAVGENKLIGLLDKSNIANPLLTPFHTQLLKYFKKFILLGGMPSVVSAFAQGIGILECTNRLDDLIDSYKDDFSKYKKHVSISLLSEVFTSVVNQSGGKFVYSKASNSSKHFQIKEALLLLIKAGLVIPVTHTSAKGIPLGAGCNNKKQKMILIDTGLFQRLLGLDISEVMFSEEFNTINKGGIAEQFVGLELLKQMSPYRRHELYYWHREARNSNAEVDYLIQKGESIIPIEVKSGNSGSMQSIRLFMNEKGISKGIRISTENFSQLKDIDIYPIYSSFRLFRNL